MNKINTLSLGAKTGAILIAAVALVLALAVPTSAQTVDCSIAVNVASCNTDNSVDDSPVNNGGTQANNGSEITQFTVTGDCSGIFTGAQVATAVGGAGGAGVGGIGAGTGGTGGAASASNVITFSPNCSVTNVTQAAAVAAAPAAAPVAQVHAPKGGVNAGAGGAAGSALPSVAALAGSLLTLGFGVVRIRQFGE